MKIYYINYLDQSVRCFTCGSMNLVKQLRREGKEIVSLLEVTA